MRLPSHFISCDWGTTNFRLRRVETASLKVSTLHQTEKGIRDLYKEYLDQHKVGQQAFFANYLLGEIVKLPGQEQDKLVISSGMSTSNMGLFELPYAQLPLKKDGSKLITKLMSLGDKKLLLVSGASSDSAMMRGEETQAIGMIQLSGLTEKAVLLLPGTHSKHLYYQEGYFHQMDNYMTGELFDVLGSKSILSNSIRKSQWDEDNSKAFKQGCKQGLSDKLSSQLLKTRARHLLGKHPEEQNYYFLSGLLIGDELSGLQDYNGPIVLGAAEPAYSLYKLALETFFSSNQLMTFDGKAMEKALLTGQRKIFENYAKKHPLFLEKI